MKKPKPHRAKKRIPMGDIVRAQRKLEASLDKQPLQNSPRRPNSLVAQLAELGKIHRNNEQSYRDKRYETLGRGAQIGALLEKDEEQFQDFKSHPYWDTQNWRDDHLFNVFLFMDETKSKAGEKRISRDARAVGFLVNKEDVDPENVAAEIKARGGLKKVCQLAAEQDPRKTKARIKVDPAREDEEAEKLNNANGRGPHSREDDWEEDAETSNYPRPTAVNKLHADEEEDDIDGDIDEDDVDIDDGEYMSVSNDSSIRVAMSRAQFNEVDQLKVGDDMMAFITLIDGEPGFEIENIVTFTADWNQLKELEKKKSDEKKKNKNKNKNINKNR